MPVPLDLATLRCRYVPCTPREDAVGFVDVTWWLTSTTGALLEVRPTTPILLHEGMLVNMHTQTWLRHLPLECIEPIMAAVFAAYDAATQGDPHA